jgi:cobaltochelatase CobS
MSKDQNHFKPIKVWSSKSDGEDILHFGPVVTVSKLDQKEHVPHEIPFCFTDQHIDILMDILAGERVLLTGHTGCGKTTALEQIAARLQVGVITMNMNECTDPSSLLGSYVARKEHKGDQTSSTIFVDGPLAQAMKKGYWVILDEVDYGSPGVMTILNGITSTTKVFINQEVIGGEHITIHSNFRLMGTANTVGPMSDYRHLYSGTPPMNPAQLERYRVHVVDYLPETEELTAVLTGVEAKLSMGEETGESLRKEMVVPFIKVANMIRELFVQGEISTPVSTRGIINWVSMFTRNVAIHHTGEANETYKAIMRAAAPAILNKMSTADALKVKEMIAATDYFARIVVQSAQKDTSAQDNSY